MPGLAIANLQVNTNLQCSGALSFNSLQSADAIHCSGSLALIGQSLISDTDLLIQADQDLSFEGVSITALTLNAQAGGAITVDAATSFHAGAIGMSASGSPAAGPLTSLPEPTTNSLLLLGLAMVALGQRVRQRAQRT